MEKIDQLSSPLALFREALIFYREHFRAILYLLALPILLRAALEFLRFEGFKLSILVIAIAAILVNILAQIAFIYLVADQGQSGVRDYLSKSRKVFWSFLWVTILAGLASVGASLLLLVPGIIVSVFLTFSSFLVVTEGMRGTAALRASWRYIRGYWWSAFARILFLVFVLLVVLAVIYYGLAPFFDSALFQELLSVIVSGFILSPIGVIFMFFFYRELKTLKAQA